MAAVKVVQNRTWAVLRPSPTDMANIGVQAPDGGGTMTAAAVRLRGVPNRARATVDIVSTPRMTMVRAHKISSGKGHMMVVAVATCGTGSEKRMYSV